MFVERNDEPELTPRESEVLERVANGLSAKETASDLHIAPRTVERHVENVRLKLGARNRAHMITRAIGLGVLRLAGVEIRARRAEPELRLNGGHMGTEPHELPVNEPIPLKRLAS